MIQRMLLFITALLAVGFLGLPVNAQSTPHRPFPQHVTYATGTLRPTNFTQAQQDNHVRAFYDYWKGAYLTAAGTNSSGQPLYRIKFGKSGANAAATVSEGQGYGMIVTALMAGYDPAAQSYFDGLWRFARTYPSGIDNRLMSWKVVNGVIVEGNASAFDGDADIAYGLLLAHAQWGSNGAINYEAAARQVLDGILAAMIGPQSHLPMLGDWVSADGSPHSQYTPRSSDFMLAHFRTFGRATNNPAWNRVITNVQDAMNRIQSAYSPTTGLLPDFLVNCNPVTSCTPSPARFLESAYDGDYYYNAGRSPWRIGVDALLNANPTAQLAVQKMVRWLASPNASGGNARNIKAGYKLDGAAIGSYFTTFFVAPFGVAAMADPTQQTFLNHIYASVYNTHEDYFEDSINLLALLVMTGNYWDPAPALAPPTATPTPTPTPTIDNTLLFADSFETGNLNNWSDRVIDGGDLSVSAGAALMGSFGMNALLDDNIAIYVTDDRPHGESGYSASFRFDPNTISMTNGDLHTIFYGYTGSATQVLRLELRFVSGLYQLRAALRDDATTWKNSAFFTITDAPHLIRLDWRAATAAGANNGSLAFRIDGGLKANLTSTDNDTRRLDRVRLGAVLGIDAGTRGGYRFDDFASYRLSVTVVAAMAEEAPEDTNVFLEEVTAEELAVERAEATIQQLFLPLVTS